MHACTGAKNGRYSPRFHCGCHCCSGCCWQKAEDATATAAAGICYIQQFKQGGNDRCTVHRASLCRCREETTSHNSSSSSSSRSQQQVGSGQRAAASSPYCFGMRPLWLNTTSVGPVSIADSFIGHDGGCYDDLLDLCTPDSKLAPLEAHHCYPFSW